MRIFSSLGGQQSGATAIDFGVLLPWVTPANGQSVEVLVIHESDSFLQDIAAVSVPLTWSSDPNYGDLWTGRLDFSVKNPAATSPRWGTAGRYIYRLAVTDPNQGRIDWVIDPYALEFGIGRQSAVSFKLPDYTWSATEASWRVPALMDLVMYEIDLAEFHGNAADAIERLDYLADLGVNCLSIMPVSNSTIAVDWGYEPAGYFGVDERVGDRDTFKALVDGAHQRGIAVIVDSVYGHAGPMFAYQDLYDRLHYSENPFMGLYVENMFSPSTDFSHPLVQDFFFAVSQHWLEEFHVDGFRYDCVPNYWDPPMGPGYCKLVYRTHEYVADAVAAGSLQRFSAAGAAMPIQVAEQLDNPPGVLNNSYSDATWQDQTLDASRHVAVGVSGSIDDFGLRLGLEGLPVSVTLNGVAAARTGIQYLESHDHERLLTAFGMSQPDTSGNDLFQLGDRSRWFKLQPYLIALLASKGIPMLWQGQEFGENYWLPGGGYGRIGLLRPVHWEYFYEDGGRTLVQLVRRLLSLRAARPELRGADYYFCNNVSEFQSKGVLVYIRATAATVTLVAVNFTDSAATVNLPFPTDGTWTEQLLGGTVASTGTAVTTTVPSNYGQVWTLG